jgi:2-methylisocitrate lyase-like PEP mutase family enzyme
MEHVATERISWIKALSKETPLLMPVAHDGLTAKLIEQAGFTACQVGGYPDIDLTHFYEQYLKAGADGIYIEGPTSEDELKQIGKAFKGEQLATSILENGGKTPWLPPKEFGSLGFTMLLYPITILFRATHAIREAAESLRAGKPLDPDKSVDMDEFEKIVELKHWQELEKRFQ